MKNENFSQAIDFLKNNESILDINNWKSFNIDFSNFTNRNNVKNEIAENIEKLLGYKNKSGLYAIFTKEREILYVGKANLLKKRIFDHYKETHLTNYPEKHKKWYEFFGKNCKNEITVKIIGIDGFNNDKILHPFLEFIEQIIIQNYFEKIKFETFRIKQ